MRDLIESLRAIGLNPVVLDDPATVDQQLEQVSFEAWARIEGYNLSRSAHEPDAYAFPPARAAWAAWQYLRKG